MYFEQLEIKHVRNLTDVTIEADPKINFFFGANATGKTAILEAIHLLSRAKSFRSHRIADIVQHQKRALSVTARLVADNREKIATGLEKNSKETFLRFKGAKITRVSEQARNIPLFLITPESHRILNGTPKERRHWLDWALFHVEPGYMDVWRAYHQALRHRNALLRERAPASQFPAWENVMSEKADHLNRHKGKYLERLQELVNKEGLFEQIRITLRPAPQNTDKDTLSGQRESDMRAGFTQSGPHRADVLFSIDGQEAGRGLSRGQAKLLITLLTVGQVIVYKENVGNDPMLLVDDISAELDHDGCRKAFDRLLSVNTQLFVNSVSVETADHINSPFTMFHVERGKVSKMVK